MTAASPGFRTPPYSIEAEQALLGAILGAIQPYGRVKGLLRPEHFYEPVHGRIYAMIERCAENGRGADPITLARAFADDEALRELNGAEYLARLVRSAETILNPEDYAAHLLDLALKRGLIQVAEDLANAACDPAAAESGPEMLAALEEKQAQLRREASALFSNDDPPLLMLDECELDPDVFWLIEDVMPRSSMAMIYGRGGCGKTYLGTSLAIGIAAGRWFDHATEPGPVLYTAFERPEDAEDRLAALRDRFGYRSLPVALKKLGGERLDHSTTEQIVQAARELATRSNNPLRAIVIDTVAAALAGKEDDEGFGRLRMIGERLHAETGAMVLWIHHEGKSDKLGPRGHTTLPDACSVWWHVEERENGDRVVHVAKANRGPVHVPVFAFRLAPFEAGIDRRGKPINLCQVELADLEAALESKPRLSYGTNGKAADPDAGLGRRQKLLIRCLEKLAKNRPEGVDRATLRSHFLLELNADRQRDGKQPLNAAGGRNAFNQTFVTLKGRSVDADGLLRPTS